MDFSAWSVELDAFTLAQSNQQFLTISVKKQYPLGESNNRKIPRGKRTAKVKAAQYAAHRMYIPP